MPAVNDYKTTYSNNKNENTLHRGSFNDFGDGTPARQVLANQPEGSDYDVIINPKGQINYIFNEVAAVAVGAEQLITEYTVGAGLGARIHKIKASGDNRATFVVKLNGSPLDTSRTWWGNFDARLSIDGLDLVANDKIEVFAINRGSMAAPFEASIGVDVYAI